MLDHHKKIASHKISNNLFLKYSNIIENVKLKCIFHIFKTYFKYTNTAKDFGVALMRIHTIVPTRYRWSGGSFYCTSIIPNSYPNYACQAFAKIYSFRGFQWVLADQDRDRCRFSWGSEQARAFKT